MRPMHGGHQDRNGADNDQEQAERGRSKALPALSLPKNRSTGNLARSPDPTSATAADKSRYRMSFDFSSAANLDPDSALTRSPIMADHEHGLGLSGLRRIRQHHPPSRTPTLPNSNSSSRSPSVVALSRSTSMSAMLAASNTFPLSGGPTSPSFTEDLSRFPTESLHSFSFAHQSEEFLHNRQNVLKRSIEYMKDRKGWSVSSMQAGLASAQARVTGDVEAQHMLELLARAQLIEAGNLPNAESSLANPGPLTGPAEVSGENLFEKHFIPRTASPEPIESASKSTVASDSAKAKRIAMEAPELRMKTDLSSKNQNITDSEESSRTPTGESATTADTSPPASRPTSLKRTLTDTHGITMQTRLLDTLAQPYVLGQPTMPESLTSPTMQQFTPTAPSFPAALGPAAHGHTNRWVPAAQAIFTTEAKPPWTIIAANDLACLVFGVTKAEVRKMGILEVVQEERRSWLERQLLRKNDEEAAESNEGKKATPAASAASALLLGGRGGITAQLLSKPNSRAVPPKTPPRRAQTVHSGDPTPPKTRGSSNHRSNLSRGVLLCGDVVPIQKRNGATGSASLWVKEKRIGLIWVMEEIHEDVANVTLDEEGVVQNITGSSQAIWGIDESQKGFDIAKLIPRVPRQGINPNEGDVDFAQIARRRYFTSVNSKKTNIPCTVEQVRGKIELKVSTFPHMAGIMVVDPENMQVRSSNAAFCSALFGFEKLDGLSINTLIPDFEKILQTLTQEEGLQLMDGMVIPEHRFRRASAFLALKEHRPDAAAAFLQPDGLQARHRDGSDLKIDVQMRIVKSEKQPSIAEETVVEEGSESEDDHDGDDTFQNRQSEIVFALWVTYSRHLHASQAKLGASTPAASGATTPLHQPSPGQTRVTSPMELSSDGEEKKKKTTPKPAPLSKQIKDAALSAAAKLTGHPKPSAKPEEPPAAETSSDPPHKKTIEDYTVLEDMGQGAYGQVKLARNKRTGKKAVLKYVTKRRILVDTWTRDRKLGTVPLEIHVLDYLRRPEFRHPNIVEMEGFFEDDVNYYIEMVPHGLPGMDLFDYIELRANMDELECRSIFVQVAQAIHFLHTKALVVHRDIKDENVILDGEGNIKLIDFGSAAYIKNGPFDVFVGTIDYAAPEVLAGKPYGGKEQDVWALGILLYTIIYKENPFYSIDEIMDRDLRIPFTLSDESIDLVRSMLNRDVGERADITQVIEHPWCRIQST
ncbi:Pkinase-domain-containing protein [Sarocladium strictum]